MLYPLVFHPIYKERVWGGRRIEELYGKTLPTQGKSPQKFSNLFERLYGSPSREDVPIGESWEIADRPPTEVSVIANGEYEGRDFRWLMEGHRASIMGMAHAPMGRFPLLVKILDARQKLSVQVHPPATVAPTLGGESKTEMWYVTNAQPDADLYVGLKSGVSRQEFLERLNDGTVESLIHRVPIKRGDAMFVPSGRIHAIGGGSVIFEIQENSDTTYRVFDWNRKGADGQPRELHIGEAIQSIQFGDVEPRLLTPADSERLGFPSRLLVECPNFTVDTVPLASGDSVVLPSGRPQILGCVEGRVEVRYEHHVEVLTPGRFCLVPACCRGTEIEGEAANLVMAIPGDGGREGQLVAPATQRRSRRKSSGLARKASNVEALRILMVDRKFRFVFLLAFLIGVVGLLGLPKMWKVTPSHVTPARWVSLLEMAQSWSMSRSAAKLAEKGEYEAATRAWYIALANQPAHLANLRGFVDYELARTAAMGDLPDQVALGQAKYLLEISRTNIVDLDRFVKLYGRSPAKRSVISHLEDVDSDQRTTSQAIELLKTTFDSGDFEGFDQEYRASPVEVQQDPEIALYHQCYVAGWGAESVFPQAMDALEAAISGPREFRKLAARLMAVACRKRADIDGYQRALTALELEGEQSLMLQLGLWELLYRNGDKEIARERAYNNVVPPTTPKEASSMILALRTLELEEEIIPFLETYFSYLRKYPDYWMLYARELVGARLWERVRGLGIEMRGERSRMPFLGAYAFFLEGLAADGEQDLLLARERFSKIPENPTEFAAIPAPLAQAIVEEIADRGYRKVAYQLTVSMEEAQSETVGYWDSRAALAYAAGETEDVLSSARRAYDQLLEQNNGILPNTTFGRKVANNFAAALLNSGEEVEKSLLITARLYAAFPQAAITRINHAQALLVNYRTQEALLVVQSIRNDGLALTTSEETEVILLEFQVAVALERWSDARRLATDLEARELSSLQRRWLDDGLAKLPVR